MTTVARDVFAETSEYGGDDLEITAVISRFTNEQR